MADNENYGFRTTVGDFTIRVDYRVSESVVIVTFMFSATGEFRMPK
jgi:hypothetical protein